MAKKPEAAPPAPPVSTPPPAPVAKKLGKRADVKTIVEAIGKEAFEVEAKGKERDALFVKIFKESPATAEWDFTGIVEGTLAQYINGARSDLGWTRARNTSGGTATASRASGEPTIKDMLAARKLANELGMEPQRLLEHVRKLKAVGDLDLLEECLDALVQLTNE